MSSLWGWRAACDAEEWKRGWVWARVSLQEAASGVTWAISLLKDCPEEEKLISQIGLGQVRPLVS